MRVIVDEDKCCGYATCLGIADQVFDIDSDNIAVVLVEHPEGEQAELAKQAAAGCPTDAIIIEE